MVKREICLSRRDAQQQLPVHCRVVSWAYPRSSEAWGFAVLSSTGNRDRYGESPDILFSPGQNRRDGLCLTGPCMDSSFSQKLKSTHSTDSGRMWAQHSDLMIGQQMPGSREEVNLWIERVGQPLPFWAFPGEKGPLNHQ